MEAISTTSIGNYQLDPASGALINIIQNNDSTFDLFYSHELPVEILLQLKILGPADLAGNSINRTISRNLLYDPKSPEIIETVICADSIILLNFSEPVLLDSASFLLDQTLIPDSIIWFPDLGSRVQLLFSEAVAKKTAINLQITAVTDSLSNRFDSLLLIQVPEMIYLARIIPLSKDEILCEWTSVAPEVLGNENFLLNEGLMPFTVEAADRYQTILKFTHPFKPGLNRLDFISHGINQELKFEWNNPLQEIRITGTRQLQLLFSNELHPDVADLKISLNDQLVNPLIFIDQKNLSVLKIVLDQDIAPDIFHWIKVDGLRDNFSRIMPSVEDSFRIDNVVPLVVGFKLIGDQTVQLTFSEPMVPSVSLNHFLKLSDQEAPEKAIWDKLQKNLELVFPGKFGPRDTLIIKDLVDLTGNRLSDTLLAFENMPLPELNSGNIIFTEILFDPLLARGLHAVSYVEIKNLSQDSIRLDQVYFADKVKAVRLPAIYLKAGDYFILTSDNYPETDSIGIIRLAGFPDLNLTGDELVLSTTAGLVIDEVNYRPDWLRLPENRSGGIALERILDQPYCDGRENWAESADPSGGTPGRPNSPLIPERPLPAVSATEVYPDSVRIIFNQRLAWNINEIQFDIDNNKGTISAENEKICFKAAQPFEAGELLQIRITGLISCSGEQVPTFAFNTGLGEKPGFNDLVITEIMSAPVETRDISVEYLEIYNPTPKIFTCSGVELWKGSTAIKLPDFILLPSEYLILCGSSSLEKLSGYGNTLSVPSFPALSNSAILSLKSGEGKLIFGITYQESWHFSSESSAGYALEMIDPDYPCGESWNWTTSLNPSGGTPGQLNSVVNSNPDLTDPQIFQVLPIDENRILLKASEKLAPVQEAIISIASYQFTLDQYLDYPELKTVQLTFPESLIPGNEYLVQIENLADCHGNINNQELQFLFPEPADSGDIVINEVLFNAGLGNVEFVELYNRSNKNIDLSGWSLNNKEVANEMFFPQDFILLPPGGHLALTRDSTKIINTYPQTPVENVINSPLPALSNQEGNLWLYDKSGNLFDQVFYHQDYHHPLLKSDADVSLERIDPQHQGTDPSNWMSAASTEGYATPGRMNSCFRQDNAGNQAVLEIDPPIISPDLDGYQDFATISFTSENPGTIASLLVYDLQGRQVKNIARRESLAAQQQFFWDGTDERRNLVSRGYYLICLELTDTNGNVTTYQQKIAVAGY